MYIKLVDCLVDIRSIPTYTVPPFSTWFESECNDVNDSQTHIFRGADLREHTDSNMEDKQIDANVLLDSDMTSWI